MHLGRDVAKSMRRYTPLSSLWYTRLLTDRLIWDQMQMQLDPEYHKSFRGLSRRPSKTTDKNTSGVRPGRAGQGARPGSCLLAVCGAD